MFETDTLELEFYRNLHRSMNACIYTIDLESYTIDWVNDNAILNDVVGLSKEEILSQGGHIAAKLLANPDFNESVTIAVDKFKEDPNLSWAGVYRIMHKDGHMNWVIYSTATLEVDEHGKAIRTVCVAIDPNHILNTPETLDDFIKYIKELRYRHVREKLTERQNEILKLIISNHSEEAIAKLLGISKYTVVDHKKLLFKKLEVKNSKELFAKAQLIGIGK